MTTTTHKLSRVIKFGIICAIAAALVRRFRGQAAPEVTGNARWKPLVEPPVPPQRAQPVAFADDAPGDTSANAATWIQPVDGNCPVSHPIKGNAGSGIFHVPGGQSYERTTAERCYASAEDAESDGFRQAKR